MSNTLPFACITFADEVGAAAIFLDIGSQNMFKQPWIWNPVQIKMKFSVQILLIIMSLETKMCSNASFDFRLRWREVEVFHFGDAEFVQVSVF